MKTSKIYPKVIGVMFIALLFAGWFYVSTFVLSMPVNDQSTTNKNAAALAAGSKADQNANSLYYRYYMILKARNKMHKV